MNYFCLVEMEIFVFGREGNPKTDSFTVEWGINQFLYLILFLFPFITDSTYNFLCVILLTSFFILSLLINELCKSFDTYSLCIYMKITFLAFWRLFIDTPKYDWDWISHHSTRSIWVRKIQWCGIPAPEYNGLEIIFKRRKSQG